MTVATRLHFLSAFAGGCVSTALIVVVWRGGADAPTAPKERTESTQSVAAPPSRVVEPSSTGDRAVAVEPTNAEVTEAARLAAPAAEPGRSVADVLAQLEAAYREELTAAAPPEAPTPERDAKTHPAEPPAALPPQPMPTTAVARAVATAAPAFTALAAAAPPPPAVAGTERSAATEVFSVNDARPQRDPADDVRRDVAIAVVQAEELQRRQLVILQYLELLAQQPRDDNVTPKARSSRFGTARRSPTFSFPLTNPDNPWGFDLPPTVLAK